MQRSGRKNLRLQEKLDAIQREISRVETDIKGISRAVDTSDPEEAFRRLKQVPGVPVAAIPVTRMPQMAGQRQSPEELPEVQMSSNSVYRGATGIPEATGMAAMPKVTPDQRFATYFGSGNLHSVRPLRQERRVQRNKALFMVCIAVLLIFWVIKMIL